MMRFIAVMLALVVASPALAERAQPAEDARADAPKTPRWEAVDATGEIVGQVFFLEPEHLAVPSHYTTPFVVLDVKTASPGAAGLYSIPVAAVGFTNVDGVGSPLGNVFAYATEDCSDTPVVDRRVIPTRRASGPRGPAPATRAGFVIPTTAPGSPSQSHQLWLPVEGAVTQPLVAQRFEAGGPCFAWAPIISPEDEAHLVRVRFEAELPPLQATPLRFQQSIDYAALEEE